MPTYYFKILLRTCKNVLFWSTADSLINCIHDISLSRIVTWDFSLKCLFTTKTELSVKWSIIINSSWFLFSSYESVLSIRLMNMKILMYFTYFAHQKISKAWGPWDLALVLTLVIWHEICLQWITNLSLTNSKFISPSTDGWSCIITHTYLFILSFLLPFSHPACWNTSEGLRTRGTVYLICALNLSSFFFIVMSAWARE